MKDHIVVYWVRRDFRLADNPAFYEAVEYAKKHSYSLLPMFILDSDILQSPNIGYCRKAYLSKLLANHIVHIPGFSIFNGSPKDIFQELQNTFYIHLFANDDVEPYALKRDNEIQSIICSDSESSCQYFQDALSVFKDVKTGAGKIYSVFSPFRNASMDTFLQSKVYNIVDTSAYKPVDLDVPTLKLFISHTDSESEEEYEHTIFAHIDSPNIVSFSNHTLNLDDIIERVDINTLGVYTNEKHVLTRLDTYISNKLLQYKTNRDSLQNDIIDGGATSRMSIALKWGLISPRYIKQKILETYTRREVFENKSIFHFISELIWREFYKYILFHNPYVLDTEFQEKFRGDRIVWDTSQDGVQKFISWMKGQTGYKVVDACMSQINHMYWMHNRGRMIVGSILTKNLGVDWRWGQNFFRCMLLDLDEASNNGGWQWSASVGADPKPIRIFNPYLQEKNYDSKGIFTKYWLTHSQYKSPDNPIVEHKLARELALTRYGLDKKTKPRDY